MHFSSELFIAGLLEKKVYYFSTDKINTPVAHYFICIKKSVNEVLIFTCCTSQIDTLDKMMKRGIINQNTIVWISPKDENNPFTKDTYINCNSIFQFSMDEIIRKYEALELKFAGEISDIHYEQIILGVLASPQVTEEVKSVLRDQIHP